LEKTIKMKRKFNIVICDPPSFSRSSKGVFKIETDLTKLLTLCWQVLEQQGILLFSSNYEKWSADEFKTKITKALSIKSDKIKAGVQNFDFELPSQAPLMKSFFVTKD
jgi:23S rRNA (cytosine1962-C5)-methyltransferase